MESEWYLQRLDRGLYTLQMVDYILGWLAMEDDGMKAHIEAMLARRSKSLKSVCENLKNQIQTQKEEVGGDDGENSRLVILEALVQFLEQSPQNS